MYMYDNLVNVYNLRTTTRQLLGQLSNVPVPPVQPNEGLGADGTFGVTNQQLTCLTGWYNWYNYQLAAADNFPLFYPSEWALTTTVSITCTPSQSECKNTAVGGE